jgi:UDP-N-acetylmuramate-alanine ligase
MREEVEKTIETVLAKPGAAIHLVGVGGSGMSALARLLLGAGQGYRVSGSDLHDSELLRRLAPMGLAFVPRHEAALVAGKDLVVYSSAIGDGNVERVEAARLGVPCVRRAELLAVLAQRRQAIVVAGMHGKTTTSAMLTQVLREAGRRPSHYIGAEVPLLDASAVWDEGEELVVEGDESDGTLVAFRPVHAILLNIEEEHLDHYGDIRRILETFTAFLDRASGTVVYCADDENTAVLCSQRITGRSIFSPAISFPSSRCCAGGSPWAGFRSTCPVPRM